VLTPPTCGAPATVLTQGYQVLVAPLSVLPQPLQGTLQGIEQLILAPTGQTPPPVTLPLTSQAIGLQVPVSYNIKYFDGIRAMDKYPAAMFIVDIKREHNAIAEARRLNIPVVAIVDTNCDPDLVTYPIAGNDDAIRSVRMIMATIGQIITHAHAEYEAKYARRKQAEEVEATAPAPAAVATPEPPASPEQLAGLQT